LFSPRALSTTSDIWDFIPGDNIEAADRVLGGHWREQHETKPLQIIRVLHAARDVQSILCLSPDEPQ
jgi:plasmid stabilization system protein ParE